MTRGARERIFLSTSLAGAGFVNARPYDIDRRARMLYGILAGSGGGGGAGFGAASGNDRGGGGSGGSAAYTMFSCPTRYLPPRIYVNVAKGGAAGTAGLATQIYAGQRNPAGLFLLSSSGGGGAGGGSASGTGGTAGAAGAAWTVDDYGIHSVVRVSAGVIGVAGATAAGAGAAGTAVVQFASGVLTPGASGASVGTDDVGYAGGDITGALDLPTILGGLANGGDGWAGRWTWGSDALGLCGTGGSGGGSNGTGIGGAGGAGGYGCGGGGGGGGTTGVAGGPGGDGFAILWWD